MSPFAKGLIVGLLIPVAFHYFTGKLPNKS